MGVQINEKNTYVILERSQWIVKLAMLNFFSYCRVHLKTCYGYVLDVIVFVFIVISSFVVYFLLEMCPYKGHLPPVFLFFGFRDSQIIFEKPSCDCCSKILD